MPELPEADLNPGQNTTRYFNSREPLNIPVLGEYLYGAPAAGNRFDAEDPCIVTGTSFLNNGRISILAMRETD